MLEWKRWIILCRDVWFVLLLNMTLIVRIETNTFCCQYPMIKKKLKKTIYLFPQASSKSVKVFALSLFTVHGSTPISIFLLRTVSTTDHMTGNLFGRIWLLSGNLYVKTVY